MKLNEALDIIRGDTGTLSDITGKAINNLYTTKFILQHLMIQLNDYARITKAIEDIYSTQLTTQTPWIDAPPLALRSEAYRFAIVLISGRIWPMDIMGFNESYSYFPVRNTSGITNWMLPWGKAGAEKFYVFPLKSSAPVTTTLTSGITAMDTTIPVVATAGMTYNDGRFTIGTEKIVYGRKDTTNFYDCLRGQEGTTAVAHLTGVTLTENNLILFYRRMHTRLYIDSDDFVPENLLATDLEVCEDHIQGVIKATCYNLLLKVDTTRAANFKVDADELYKEYAEGVRRGRSAIRNGTNIRPAFLFESGQPGYTNLL
jgi:hypothetical protein